MILLKNNIQRIYSVYTACLFLMYIMIPNGKWDAHKGYDNTILENLDHLCVFFVFGVLANLTNERLMFLNFYTKITISISILIEFIHLILPYRGFELIDFAFNIIGCLFGIISFYYIRKLLWKNY